MAKYAQALIAVALAATPATAAMRQFCNPHGTCFICQRGTATCEVTYALSRGLTPPTAPSLDRILPPSPSPNPGPLYPERYQAERPRPPQPPRQLPPSGKQRGLTEEEWRQAILDEAQKFCEAYPHNQQCHWKEPPPQ